MVKFEREMLAMINAGSAFREVREKYGFMYKVWIHVYRNAGVQEQISEREDRLQKHITMYGGKR